MLYSILKSFKKYKEYVVALTFYLSFENVLKFIKNFFTSYFF